VDSFLAPLTSMRSNSSRHSSCLIARPRPGNFEAMVNDGLLAYARDEHVPLSVDCSTQLIPVSESFIDTFTISIFQGNGASCILYL
jgi:hypothetical protein